MSSIVAVELTELQPAQAAPSLNLARLTGSAESFHHTSAETERLDRINADELSLRPPASESNPASTLRLALTILQPSLVNFLSSFTNGIITVGLPAIAESISLPRSLYLWPLSVYGLTSGSMLLIAGPVADLIGPRRVELVGILLLGVFTLACGLSTTGVQLVIFRALQGLAMAMHLPASVALVAAGLPEGRARNIGFGCLGLSQPLGWSIGLVVSGILIERVGWRSGFYMAGGAALLVAVVAFFLLPKVKPNSQRVGGIRKTLFTEIDWIGGALGSGGLTLLAYVLALISADLSAIRSAQTVSLLFISLILLIAFPFWMHYRERAGKPALIPNTLWKNLPFTSTCVMVMLSYGALNAMELFSSLYFQDIQNVSTLTTSLYLLPNMVIGVIINLSVGLFVHRLPARWLVTLSALLCSIAPFIMARVNPASNYWLLEFWGQVFTPVSGDVLFTVGLIIVSDNFPKETQALAGAVFNTVAQFGQSLGIGVCQVVALGVAGNADTGQQGGNGVENMDEGVLLEGYRASFWTMFAYMVACGFIAIIGLRKAGKIGLKRE